MAKKRKTFKPTHHPDSVPGPPLPSSVPLSAKFIWNCKRFAKYRLMYALQEGRCFYCQQYMAPPTWDEPFNFPNRVTIEHIYRRD